MTLNLKALETSFDLVAPRGDELMDVFYARLFAAAPAVKPRRITAFRRMAAEPTTTITRSMAWR